MSQANQQARPQYLQIQNETLLPTDAWARLLPVKQHRCPLTESQLYGKCRHRQKSRPVQNTGKRAGKAFIGCCMRSAQIINAAV